MELEIRFLAQTYIVALNRRHWLFIDEALRQGISSHPEQAREHSSFSLLDKTKERHFTLLMPLVDGLYGFYCILSRTRMHTVTYVPIH